MNFFNLSLDNINKYGEYTFLNFEDQEYTNADIERLSNRLAHGLQNRGLQEGDRVVMFLTNMPEVLISYQAILRTGAIIVPVNPALSFHELSYIIDHSEAVIVITSTALVETVRKAKEISSVRPSVIVAGKEHHEEDFISFTDCYTNNDAFLMIDRPDEATAVIIYTSGTTGTPKGVMISHFNLYMKSHGDSQQIGLIDANGTLLLDKVNLLAVLPFSHVYGLMTMGVAYVSRGRIFLLPTFDIEQILKQMQENEITVFGGVPTMYAWFAVFPGAEKYDTSSVVRWLSGSAPLSVEARNAFEKRFNKKIMDAYGLTETLSGTTMQRHDRPFKPGSVGPATPGAEIRVVDENGTPLPFGQIGELTVKGPYVMKGYYKNEEETARVIKEGWLYTGDIGYMDEEGEVYIVERKKDLIIRGGFNIYPSEVEKVLCSHPDIIDAGVLGIDDKEYGEQVCAFIVPKEG